ncbi:MAG: hypothetical protein WCC17_22395 [Candidatus Nitrosopolaris sp.]
MHLSKDISIEGLLVSLTNSGFYIGICNFKAAIIISLSVLPVLVDNSMSKLRISGFNVIVRVTHND